MSVVALTVPLELADGGTAYVGAASGLGDLFVVNTTGYNSISVQLTGTWSATVTFSISNDGITWVPVGTVTSNNVYIYPTTGIYFKGEVTAYTSGTVNALAYLRFQQVADITVDADLTQINTNTLNTANNTLATANNTATANTYLQQIANEIGETSVPITGTLSGNGTLISTETLGYSTISVQLSGFWTCEVTFQSSNDNVNWVNTQGFGFNSSATAIDTAVDNDIYILPVVGRYFRIVVSQYLSGPISATAYLRNQSMAGLGEASLTQAMDSSTVNPLNVTYQGIQGAGQQPAVNSMPVALANEQILDKTVFGKVHVGNTLPVNSNLLLEAQQFNQNYGQGLDVSQYRSITFQINMTTAVAVTVSLEGSNDGINWYALQMYDTTTVSVLSPGQYQTSFSLGVSTSTNRTISANLVHKYVRFRNQASLTGYGNLQIVYRLSMMPYVGQTNVGANLNYIGSSSMPGAATMTSASSTSAGFTPVIIGGTDRSILRQELLGNMGAGGIANSYNTNGPYARNAYTDLAGLMGAGGPQPFLAEDKTYPVNVRLERTTNGQDSVQDLLQQILVELKALSYYTRETPVAIATALSTASPTNPVSMLDDPENFFDDPTLYQYRKGH